MGSHTPRRFPRMASLRRSRKDIPYTERDKWRPADNFCIWPRALRRCRRYRASRGRKPRGRKPTRRGQCALACERPSYRIAKLLSD
jgi:hypothetical protein